MRGGGFAAEGGLVGVGAAGVAGGGNAGGAVVPLAITSSLAGGMAGAEVDVVVGPHDAIIVEGDAAKIAAPGGSTILASASWTHGWEHFHLQVGVYTLGGTTWSNGNPSFSVGPYANVYWVFGRQ